jgi:hypothetical protein
MKLMWFKSGRESAMFSNGRDIRKAGNEGNSLPMADIRKAAWALVRPASTATGGRWWNGMNRPEINYY